MDGITVVRHEEEFTLYAQSPEIETTPIKGCEAVALSILGSVTDYLREQDHPLYRKASSTYAMSKCSTKFKNLRDLIKEAYPSIRVVENSVNRDPVDKKILIAKEFTVRVEHQQQTTVTSDADWETREQSNHDEMKVLAIAQCAMDDINKTFNLYERKEIEQYANRHIRPGYVSVSIFDEWAERRRLLAKPDRIEPINKRKCCVSTLICVGVTVAMIGVIYLVACPCF